MNKIEINRFQICMAIQEGKGVSGTDEAGNTYAVFNDQWVSYDTPKTVAEKVNNITLFMKYVNSISFYLQSYKKD